MQRRCLTCDAILDESNVDKTCPYCGSKLIIEGSSEGLNEDPNAGSVIDDFFDLFSAPDFGKGGGNETPEGEDGTLDPRLTGLEFMRDASIAVVDLGNPDKPETATGQAPGAKGMPADRNALQESQESSKQAYAQQEPGAQPLPQAQTQARTPSGNKFDDRDLQPPPSPSGTGNPASQASESGQAQQQARSQAQDKKPVFKPAANSHAPQPTQTQSGAFEATANSPNDAGNPANGASSTVGNASEPVASSGNGNGAKEAPYWSPGDESPEDLDEAPPAMIDYIEFARAANPAPQTGILDYLDEAVASQGGSDTGLDGESGEAAQGNGAALVIRRADAELMREIKRREKVNNPVFHTAYSHLTEGRFAEAFESFSAIFLAHPNDADAAIGRLLARRRVREEEELTQLGIPLTDDPLYKEAWALADPELQELLESWDQAIIDRNEQIRNEQWRAASELREQSRKDYERAAKMREAAQLASMRTEEAKSKKVKKAMPLIVGGVLLLIVIAIVLVATLRSPKPPENTWREPIEAIECVTVLDDSVMKITCVSYYPLEVQETRVVFAVQNKTSAPISVKPVECSVNGMMLEFAFDSPLVVEAGKTRLASGKYVFMDDLELNVGTAATVGFRFEASDSESGVVIDRGALLKLKGNLTEDVPPPPNFEDYTAIVDQVPGICVRLKNCQADSNMALLVLLVENNSDFPVIVSVEHCEMDGVLISNDYEGISVVNPGCCAVARYPFSLQALVDIGIEPQAVKSGQFGIGLYNAENMGRLAYTDNPYVLLGFHAE